MALNDNLKGQLKKVHTLAAAAGFAYLNPKSPMVKVLIDQGALAVDAARVDPADPAKFAAWLTDSGKHELGLPVGSPAPAPAPLEPTAPVVDPASSGPVQAIPATANVGDGAAVAGVETKTPRGPRIVPVIAATGVRMKMPVVERQGFGKRQETYPFSTLGAPIEENGEKLLDSFFVEATAENPAPAKSLAGTVSSANKRFALDVKKFSVVHIENDAEHNKKGARVLRVA